MILCRKIVNNLSSYRFGFVYLNVSSDNPNNPEEQSPVDAWIDGFLLDDHEYGCVMSAVRQESSATHFTPQDISSLIMIGPRLRLRDRQ